MFFCLVKELKGTGKRYREGGGGPKQIGVVHDVLSLVQEMGCTILSYP